MDIFTVTLVWQRVNIIAIFPQVPSSLLTAQSILTLILWRSARVVITLSNDLYIYIRTQIEVFIRAIVLWVDVSSLTGNNYQMYTWLELDVTEFLPLRSVVI